MTTAPPDTAGASSSSASEILSRSEAGPLPVKRGEIGYVEGQAGFEPERSSPELVLPERHPADRDAPPAAPAASTSSDHHPSPSSTTTLTNNIPPNNSSSTTLVSSSNSTKKSFLKYLTPKTVPSICGFRLTTLLIFAVQLLFAGGTITGWVLSTQRLVHDQNSAAPSSSTLVFIHVIFGVALLAQLLFLERRTYRLRAERYSYKHPGEILPTSRRRLSGATLAYAPWNRPPLPTYAAALAQSGVGTGDVEDSMIAVQPPPAYGHTRGSVMLLSGYLRESLRAQRPASVHSQNSQTNHSRPVSYRSQDEEWETIQDADRARRLEETLARLERPSSRA